MAEFSWLVTSTWLQGDGPSPGWGAGKGEDRTCPAETQVTGSSGWVNKGEGKRPAPAAVFSGNGFCFAGMGLFGGK